MNPDLIAAYGTDDPDTIDAILARREASAWAADAEPPVECPPVVAPARVGSFDPAIKARREYAELWFWQRWRTPKPAGWPTQKERWNPTGLMSS